MPGPGLAPGGIAIAANATANTAETTIDFLELILDIIPKKRGYGISTRSDS